MRHERRVLWTALAAGLPAVLVALLLLWIGDYAPRVQWTVGAFIVILWLGFAFSTQERVIRPLQTLSNMLAALREGDFSLRARGADPEDALGLALLEVNELRDTLREERLGAVEATALLGRVMAELDVAILAFDDRGALRLVNRGGENLLAAPAARVLGRTATELGMVSALEGDNPRVADLAFGGRVGRWEIRRSTFRQGGRPHQLIMLSDLSKTLRDEERQAWQRLVRVLSHEINNSLAPIKSIAGSLQTLLERNGDSAGHSDDLKKGLGVIATRSEALGRFMSAYARLARLPRPKLEPLAVGPWVRKVAGLETRRPITVLPGPDVTVQADEDQLDQLLINLIGNASDAVTETGGGVHVTWDVRGRQVELVVEDEGPGLPPTGNLFVPFFTTKPGGSGIGLVLSRQIAEGHGGTVALENRKDGKGCVARVTLSITES